MSDSQLAQLQTLWNESKDPVIGRELRKQQVAEGLLTQEDLELLALCGDPSSRLVVGMKEEWRESNFLPFVQSVQGQPVLTLVQVLMLALAEKLSNGCPEIELRFVTPDIRTSVRQLFHWMRGQASPTEIRVACEAMQKKFEELSGEYGDFRRASCAVATCMLACQIILRGRIVLQEKQAEILKEIFAHQMHNITGRIIALKTEPEEDVFSWLKDLVEFSPRQPIV